jgi:DNA-binding SARP family transcriptional activator
MMRSGAALSGEPSDAVRLGLMRGFELDLRGRSIPLPVSAQRVVAFLALRARPTRRSHVAGMLWLNATEDRAMGNLRSALWRLRRNRCDVVDVVGESLALSRRVIVDVHVFSEAARRLDSPTDPGPRPSLDSPVLDQIVDSGELLPDWYDDWVIVERERLRQLRLHALERACDDLVAVGRYGEAIAAGLAAVHEEPLRESAHRSLITAHLAEGNRIEAFRQFENYAALMRVELQLEPSSDIQDLVASAGMTIATRG